MSKIPEIMLSEQQSAVLTAIFDICTKRKNKDIRFPDATASEIQAETNLGDEQIKVVLRELFEIRKVCVTPRQGISILSQQTAYCLP